MVTTQSTQTRTTAPVVKYTCLYTRDLKRKHKRWQDGRLEFHAFNRRVMVYDDGGNFVGDSHRTKSSDFEDGDEFELDRGNIIVQVAERVGQRQQDITEIFTRKPKGQDASTQPPTAGTVTPRARPLSSHFQMRHLPLQSLLSTPGRQVGRAMIPTTSPFEQRNQTLDDTNCRPKRRKLDTAEINNQATTAILPHAFPSSTSRPTNPIPPDPHRRKWFSPPRAHITDSSPTNSPKNATLIDVSSGKQIPSRPVEVQPAFISPQPVKPVQSEADVLPAESPQPADSPTRHPVKYTRYEPPSTGKGFLAGKKPRSLISKKGEKDQPFDGKLQPPNKQISKTTTQFHQPSGPRLPDEPTTTLRLGSAQKRGLLVAKGPPAKQRERERGPAQHAGGRVHAGPLRTSDRNPSSEVGPMADMGKLESGIPLPTTAQKTGSGRPVSVVHPVTQTPACGGPWSREAGDLLDYKRSTAEKSAR